MAEDQVVNSQEEQVVEQQHVVSSVGESQQQVRERKEVKQRDVESQQNFDIDDVARVKNALQKERKIREDIEKKFKRTNEELAKLRETVIKLSSSLGVDEEEADSPNDVVTKLEERLRELENARRKQAIRDTISNIAESAKRKGLSIDTTKLEKLAERTSLDPIRDADEFSEYVSELAQSIAKPLANDSAITILAGSTNYGETVPASNIIEAVTNPDGTIDWGKMAKLQPRDLELVVREIAANADVVPEMSRYIVRTQPTFFPGQSQFPSEPTAPAAPKARRGKK